VFGLEKALYVVFVASGAWARVRAGRFEVRIPLETRDFFFSKKSRPLLTPNRPCINGCQGCFQWVQWPGCDVDQSPSRSVVKKGWSYTSTSRICLHVVGRHTLTLFCVLQVVTWISRYFRPGRMYAQIVTFLSRSLCCGPWILDF